MSEIANRQAIYKRLLPLYVAVFFQGFVLWYTIEKLFMRSIGFDDAGIGVMVAAYSVVMLVVETPSGILADRWSRKGVLILASIALALGSLIGGLSHSQFIYICSALLWGTFFALYSGTYDSMVYDTIYEETDSSGLFEQFYGKLRMVDSIALVSGSLLGGIIASQFGLRWAYFLTIPSALLAIVALLIFREPKLHKAEVAAPIVKHIRQTFGAVLRNKDTLVVIIVLTLLSIVTYMLLEFSQLWILALALPTVLYGPANAVLLAGLGIGGGAAGYLRIYRYPVMLLVISVMLASALGLIFARNPVLIVASQVGLCVTTVGIGVVFNRLLHDSLSSSVRAGAASAVSSITRTFVIPLAIVFGIISNRQSVFTSSWMLLGLVVVSVIFILIEINKDGRKGLYPKEA